MVRSPATVVSRIARAAADDPLVSDQELLRRYAAGDQGAFAGLVRRHASLVLGVCQRALGNVQDAEDACQATFLVLARKARTGKWQACVANWLYTTARRVARNARVAASRRAAREGKAARTESVALLDQMTGRELATILDDELDQLSEKYREALVLCYLQGLTRDEAAVRLGVPVATLKRRLERGRKRLGDALTKRGVTIGTGLLAFAATSRAGASPPRFVESVVATVSGSPPATVVALAEGVAVNGILKKTLAGVMLLAMAAAAGFGPGDATTAGQPPEKAMPAKPKAKAEAPADKAKADTMRTVTGTVVDPDGKPVAGAEVINLPREGGPTVAGKTDADGKFKVTVPMKGSGSWLFARVAGFGSDFLMPATNTPAEHTFRLIKDAPIRGRVLDTQGKPVAGAAVVLQSLEGFEKDSLDAYLKAFLKRDSDGQPMSGKWHVSFTPIGDRKLSDGTPVFAATTDKDGRFSIAGVGAERVLRLVVSAPGFAMSEVTVLTRPGFDPAPYNAYTVEKLKSQFSEIGYHPTLYPPEANIVAEAEKPIRGTVTELGTGKPRAGVTVRLHERRTSRLPDLRATTDAAGRYEIRGARKETKYRLEVKRDADAGLVGRTIQLGDTTGYEPIAANIEVAKGIILTGRILDDATGKPVQGFACVGVLYDNEFAKKPGYDSPDCYDFAHSKADGTYRTVVPPGPVLLMGGPSPDGNQAEAEAHYQQMKTDPDYPQYFEPKMSGFRSPDNVTTIMQGQWCKVLKLKPDQAEVTVDIRFKPASKFLVKVRDAAGKPVTGARATGNTARDWASPVTCEGDTCPVYELESAKPRVVAFVDSKGTLVGTITLKGDEKDATVTLGPTGTIKGKLVTPGGQPIANAAVALGYEHRAVSEISDLMRGGWRGGMNRVETNAAGEFTLDRVVPGVKFTVYARKKDEFLETPDRKTEPRFTVEAQKTLDVGSIVLKVD
jgi:RNA polymerase sigma factor (sigma-70 family)